MPLATRDDRGGFREVVEPDIDAVVLKPCPGAGPVAQGMLGAEGPRIQRGIGGGCSGRLEGGEAAGALGGLLLRPRKRWPERQEKDHKHDADAHDFPLGG